MSYREGDKLLKITDAQRDSSSTVACIAYSNAGILFRNAELNVYSELSPLAGLQESVGKMKQQDVFSNHKELLSALSSDTIVASLVICRAEIKAFMMTAAPKEPPVPT